MKKFSLLIMSLTSIKIGVYCFALYFCLLRASHPSAFFGRKSSSKLKVFLTKSYDGLFLKFIYSEKATKFCKISTADLSITKGQKILKKKYVVLDSSKKRTLGQFSVNKIALAFGFFRKNSGKHIFFSRFSDL